MTNFQRCKPFALEIYQLAAAGGAWDMSDVLTKEEKRAEQEASARDIAKRLRQLDLPAAVRDSNNEWCRRAGVNTSFFTALSKGSDPSVNNLRRILRAAGSSLPEFFLHEASRDLARRPTRQELEQALLEALDGPFPKGAGRRAEYLAQAVEQLLELPADRRHSQDAA